MAMSVSPRAAFKMEWDAESKCRMLRSLTLSKKVNEQCGHIMELVGRRHSWKVSICKMGELRPISDIFRHTAWYSGAWCLTCFQSSIKWIWDMINLLLWHFAPTSCTQGGGTRQRGAMAAVAAVVLAFADILGDFSIIKNYIIRSFLFPWCIFFKGKNMYADYFLFGKMMFVYHVEFITFRHWNGH